MSQSIYNKVLSGILCLLCLLVFSNCGKDNEELEPPTPTGYVDKMIQGFTVKIAAKDEKFQLTQQALAKITSDLNTIVSFYTAEQLVVLRAHPIWMEMNLDPNGAARYHPSAQWLIDNGLNPGKAKCVEISNMANYITWTAQNQPLMLLHELSHLYHDQALANGFNNVSVLNAFNAAKTSGKYNAVRYYNGTDTLNNKKAYAMDNQMEYFAEISEAYFGNNDYQPFTHNELQTFDSAGFNVLVNVWGARP